MGYLPTRNLLFQSVLNSQHVDVLSTIGEAAVVSYIGHLLV